MQTYTSLKVAAGSPLERLMKQHGQPLTPQEMQVLSLTQEDLDGLTSATSYELIFQGVDQILRRAYNKNPQFRAMIGREPKDATKVVSKLIQYVEGQTGVMVHHDPTQTARQLLEAIYIQKSDQRMPDGKKPEQVSTDIAAKQPMSSDTLKLFGLMDVDYTAGITREKISEAMKSFINQVDPTKMSVEDASEYLYSFLKGIKQKKQLEMEMSGKTDFSEGDKRLFSGTDVDLKKKARDIYLEYTKVTQKTRSDSPTQIDTWIRELMLRIRNLITDMKSTFSDTLRQMDLQKQTAMPPKDELTSKIDGVTSALAAAGITEQEFPYVVDIDTESMRNDPLFNNRDELMKKYDINAQRIKTIETLLKEGIPKAPVAPQVPPTSAKQAADDDISEAPERKQISEEDSLKNELAERKKEQESLAPKVEILRKLDAKKDKVEAAMDRVEDYLKFLGQYKANIIKHFAPSSETSKEMFKDLYVLRDRFSAIKSFLTELSQQAEFKRLWEGKDVFFGKQPQPAVEKKAADDKPAPEGKGEANNDEDAMEAVDELISLLQPTSENTGDFEKDILGTLEMKLKSMRDPSIKAPEGSLFQILKNFDRLLKLFEKFSPSKVYTSYAKKIDNMAAIKKFYIKSLHKEEKKEKNPKTPKLASCADIIRKYASFLKESFKPRVEMKKPDWMVFISKFKRAGKDVAKKSFINFFDKSPVLNRFLNEIGKQGFNFMDMKGGKEDLTYPDPASAEAKIDKVLATVLKDFEGNLEDHVANEAGQKRATEDGIEKARETIKSENARAKKLSEGMLETKQQFLPKLDKMAEFLGAPIKYLERHSEEDPDAKKILSEMDLTPEERKDIKSEIHEEKSGRKTLMDKSWYKKNMIKFFNHYIKGNPLSDKLTTGQTVKLDDAELKRQAQELREARDAETRMNYIINSIESAHKDRYNFMTHLKGIKEDETNGLLGKMADLQKRASVYMEEANLRERLIKEHGETADSLEKFLTDNKDSFNPDNLQKNETIQAQIKQKLLQKNAEIEAFKKEVITLSNEISNIQRGLEDASKKMSALYQQLRSEKQSGAVRKEMMSLQRNLDFIDKKIKADTASGKPETPKDKNDLETITKRIELLKNQERVAPAEEKFISKLDMDLKKGAQTLKSAPDFTLVDKNVVKTSAMEDSWGDTPMSTHDIITQTVPEDAASKGKPFPTKVRDWDIFEHLFGKDIDRLKAHKEVLNKGGLPEEVTKEIYKQIVALSSKISQKAQRVQTPIELAGEKMKIGDVGKRFNALFDEYQNKLNKAYYQRNDALKRVNEYRDKLMAHEEYIDPTTGDFKPMSKEEKRRITGYYLDQLYKELDEKWSTTVGSENLFSRKEGPKYDTVFNTFKNLGAVKSNRKIMNQIGEINRAMRAQFQEYPKYRNRMQELEDEIKTIEDQYSDMGQDPTRIIQPKKEELDVLNNKVKQKDLLFRKMLDAITKEEKANILEGIYQLGKKKGELDPDIESDMTKNIETVRDEAKDDVEKVAVISSGPTDVKDVGDVQDAVIDQLKDNALAKKPEEPVKTAAEYMKDKNFNIKLLYGSVMQKTIYDMAMKDLAN